MKTEGMTLQEAIEAYSLTQEQARALMEAHDIWALLDNEEEVAALTENNPDLLGAYQILQRVAVLP